MRHKMLFNTIRKPVQALLRSCTTIKEIYKGNKSHFYFWIFMPILQFLLFNDIWNWAGAICTKSNKQTNETELMFLFFSAPLFHIRAHDPNISGPLRTEIATILIPLNIITTTDRKGKRKEGATKERKTDKE